MMDNDLYDEFVDEVLTGIEQNDDLYTSTSTDYYYYGYWLDRAILYDRLVAVKVILDTLQIPDNLTLKEKICYIQLLGTQ